MALRRGAISLPGIRECPQWPQGQHGAPGTGWHDAPSVGTRWGASILQRRPICLTPPAEDGCGELGVETRTFMGTSHRSRLHPNSKSPGPLTQRHYRGAKWTARWESAVSLSHCRWRAPVVTEEGTWATGAKPTTTNRVHRRLELGVALYTRCRDARPCCTPLVSYIKTAPHPHRRRPRPGGLPAAGGFIY